MFVLNPCHSDARVRKEAAALGHDGFEVRVFALGNSTWPAGIIEEDGFTIERIEVVSILTRILWLLRRVYLATAGSLIRLRAFRFARRLRGVVAGSPPVPSGEAAAALPVVHATRTPLPRGRTPRVDLTLPLVPSDPPHAPDGSPDLEVSGFSASSPVWRTLRGARGLTRRVARPVRLILLYSRRGVRRLLRRTRVLLLRSRRRARRSVRLTLRWMRRRVRAFRRRVWLLRHHTFVRIAATLRWIYRTTHRVLRRMLLPFHRPSVVRQFQLAASAAAANWQPDIVHAHDGNTLQAGRRVARTGDAKLVYDTHELWRRRNRGGELRPLGRTWDAIVERSAAPHCDLVITVSDGIADWLADTYQLRRPVVVVRNIPERTTALQTAQVPTIRTLVGAGPDERIVLYTGRITSGRGLDPLITAVGLLPDTYRLVLLGYGDPFFVESVWKLARSAGVTDRITIVPPVASDEVSATARGADVAYVGIEPVCLSYRLALPNKLFEAIHGELPVVASDLPELRATVTRYGLGELFPLDDPAGIAAAIERVCVDPRYREAARRAIEELDWHQEKHRLLQAYTELLDEPLRDERIASRASTG